MLNKSLLFAATTATTALALLTVAAPGQAAPEACAQYAFNGDFIINGANIGEVLVTDVLPGTRFAGRTLNLSVEGPPVRGFIQDGSIKGRNINFIISWLEESETTWTFTGTIGDDGLVYRGIMHGPGFMGLWDSTTPLACNDLDIATKPLPDDVITPPVPATTRVPSPITAP